MLPLTFTAPWILAALALLPVIWWLLRLTPPRPRSVQFPPTRLLLDIDQHEETPQRSPWWLTLLRLLLAALLIIALAGPVWRTADPVQTGDGVLWLIVDNGWTSARDWEAQKGAAEQILTTAEQAGQPVLFLRRPPKVPART
ncbi:BatA domain-containing protein [Roseibium salinum]|nr:BatA domain-containing protein [Roseibium salinum]